MHSFVVIGQTDTNVDFQCSNCMEIIGFNKPGVGEPSAVDNNGVWIPPEDVAKYVGPSCAAVIPESITKLQFLIQLLRSGFVDPSEAPTISTAPPAFLAPVFAAMPTEQALEAQLTWAAMTRVERHGPLMQAAAAAAQITEQQLDDFFRAAASI